MGIDSRCLELRRESGLRVCCSRADMDRSTSLGDAE